VDRDRIRVPTSGTAVRGNASEQWENISNPVSLVACCEYCSLVTRSTSLEAVGYVQIILYKYDCNSSPSHSCVDTMR
jgi:hypothetical protein